MTGGPMLLQRLQLFFTLIVLKRMGHASFNPRITLEQTLTTDDMALHVHVCLFPSPPSFDDAVLGLTPSLSLPAFNRVSAIVPCAQKGFSKWGTMNRRNRMCWWDCIHNQKTIFSIHCMHKQ